MKITFFVFFLTVTFTLRAQNYHAKNIIMSSKCDYYNVASITTDSYNNTYIGGFFNGTYSLGGYTLKSNTQSSLNNTLFIAKIDSSDVVQWIKIITEIQSPYYQRVKIQCDKKNNLLLAFNFADSMNILGHNIISIGSSDALLLKLDSLGDYLWHFTINGLYGESIGLDEIGIMPNNDIVISGGFGGYSGSPNPIATTDFGGTILTTKGADGYLARYTETSSLIWVRRGGTNNLIDGYAGSLIDINQNLYSLISLDPSYNIYFDSAYHYTFPQQGYTASAIVKYNSVGTLKWVKGIYTPNFPDIAGFEGMCILKNLQVVVFGSYNSLNSVLLEGHSSFPPNITGTGGTNEYLSFLVCYDSLGNVLWAKNPHKLISSTEQPIGVVGSKTNSDFYFVSYFDGSSIISGTDTVYGTGYQNVLIECMDSMGNKKWHKIIKGFPGANARDIAINDNNEIIIVGNTSSSTLQCDAKKVNISSTPAMYILKLAPGNVNWNDTLNGFEDVVVSKEQLVVYPNPAQQSIVISHQSLVNTIVVTDVLGRVCSIPPFERLQIPKESGGLGGFELNISTLSKGIYFIKATDVNGNQLNGKFVKQ
ncbi:MAG: hypothetical protein RL708_766 [Bacteroidota bacterium]|jgi:hypothetical protein